MCADLWTRKIENSFENDAKRYKFFNISCNLLRIFANYINIAKCRSCRSLFTLDKLMNRHWFAIEYN